MLLRQAALRGRSAWMLREIASACADIFTPLACLECHRETVESERPFCVDCINRLPWWRRLDGCPRCGFVCVENIACPRCYADGSPLHQCHALLRYEGRPRDWIPRFKHLRSPFGPPLESRIAIEFFAQELALRLAARRSERPDLIVPIALHKRRRRQRGFNHCDVISRQIGKLLDIPVVPDALVRQIDTRSQATLPYEKRRANLRGAFRASDTVRGVERIWLVDDVLTTGATFDAAGDACLESGVLEVHALTLAATPPLGRGRFPAPPGPHQRATASQP